MSEIEIIERHYLEAKFRAVFQNAISRLVKREKLVSKTFIVHDIPWNISLKADFPKTHCYLNCLEMKPGFSLKVSYKFSAIRVSGQPLEKENTTIFNENVLSGAIESFSQLAKLSMPTEKFIFDDALTIQVELKAELPPTFVHRDSKEELIRSLQPSTANGVIKDMDALFESGDSDITFTLKDGAIIKAHKNILCARNAVFATMLSVDMKEAKTKVVMIDDMGKSALKILLLHIYTGLLSLPKGMGVESCKEVVNAAEKYNLPELKEVAGMALVELAMKTPDDAFEHYKFLKGLNVGAATRVLASYIKRNFDEILEKC